MPLVTPNDNGIDIPFTSNADEVVRESKRVMDQLDKVKAQVKQNGDMLEKQAIREQVAVQKSKLSWTDFRSAYQTVIDAVRVGGQIWGETIGQLVEYGDQVKKLSVITGQSAEETSRQIQMADDLRISYDDLTRSLQFASKNGVDTSIEGLVKLGEEYKKLSKGTEQTEFLMKKFGKSGIELDKILRQTSGTIRDLAANTPDGLILSDKDIAEIDAYNKSLDTLNDNFTALKMSASKVVLPNANKFISMVNDDIQFFENLASGMSFTDAAVDALRNAESATLDLGDAALSTSEDVGELEDPLKAAEEAAKALSKVYTGLLSSMFAINDEQDSYKQKLDDLAASSEDLAAEKDRLTLAMWEEQRAGKMTNDEYLRYIQQLDEITEKQEENAQAVTDAAAEHEKAATQRVYDLVQERLAADGVVDSGEFEYLQELAVQKGLVSRAAADQAIAESQAADQLVASFAKTQPAMDTALMTMQEISKYHGAVVNFGVNFTQSGSFQRAEDGSFVPNSFYNDYSSPGIGRGRAQRRDSGGSGIAGTAYQIGVEEVYVPSTGGQFIPLGGANAQNIGGTTIINVYNPKKETAESSIRRELKSLSYTGAMP